MPEIERACQNAAEREGVKIDGIQRKPQATETLQPTTKSQRHHVPPSA